MVVSGGYPFNFPFRSESVQLTSFLLLQENEELSELHDYLLSVCFIFWNCACDSFFITFMAGDPEIRNINLV